MAKSSAGVLLFRTTGTTVEVLLVHPGGPFWARKDEGSWSLPKGEIADGEDPLATALRELQEETGAVPAGPPIALGAVRQRGGKVVHAWAAEGDFDPATLRSNRFTMEWPPRSGRQAEFPEVDRAAWFDLETASRKILEGQKPFLEALITARNALL